MAGESAMKNAIPRRAHRERAQPSHRKKFGLLEKHKDYIERSGDYKKKQKVIKTLKTKASERNPDEFYFKMHNTQVVNGLHTKIQKGLDHETIQLLKTQDLNYIIHKKAIDDRKIEKLKVNLHKIDDIKQNKHTKFVDSLEALNDSSYENNNNNTKDSNILIQETTLGPKAIKPSTNALLSNNNKIPDRVKRKINKACDRTYKELSEREERSKKLTTALHALSLQREVMKKGTKRKLILNTVNDDNEDDDNDGDEDDKPKAIFKWKRERQR